MRWKESIPDPSTTPVLCHTVISSFSTSVEYAVSSGNAVMYKIGYLAARGGLGSYEPQTFKHQTRESSRGRQLRFRSFGTRQNHGGKCASDDRIRRFQGDSKVFQGVPKAFPRRFQGDYNAS